MAENPNTLIGILIKLSTNRNKYIRRRVAMNPNICNMPKKYLIKLAEDKSYNIRSQIAENPNTPTEVLNILLFNNNNTNNIILKSKIEAHPNTSKKVVIALKMENLKKLLKARKKKKMIYKAKSMACK